VLGAAMATGIVVYVVAVVLLGSAEVQAVTRILRQRWARPVVASPEPR